MIESRDGLGRLVSVFDNRTRAEGDRGSGSITVSLFTESGQGHHICSYPSDKDISLSTTTANRLFDASWTNWSHSSSSARGLNRLFAVGIVERHKKAETPAFNSLFQIHSWPAAVIYWEKTIQKLYSIT